MQRTARQRQSRSNRERLGRERHRAAGDMVGISRDRVGAASEFPGIVVLRIRTGRQPARTVVCRARSAEGLDGLARLEIRADAPPGVADEQRDLVGPAEALVARHGHGQAFVQLVQRDLAADADRHGARLQAGRHGAVREDLLLGRELVAAGAEGRPPEILRIDGDARRQPLGFRLQGRQADAAGDGARIAAMALRALRDMQPEGRELHAAHAEGGAPQTLVYGNALGDGAADRPASCGRSSIG